MKAPLEDAAAISREIVHGYYAGNMEPYISRLCDKSVRMGAGDRELVGGGAIRSWLESAALERPYKIYQEEYSPVFLSRRCQAVTAKVSAVVPGQDRDGVSATYTFLYQLIGKETKLLLIHANYEPLRPFAMNQDGPVLEAAYRLLRDLLLESPEKRRLSIPCGGKTVFLHPDRIVYVRSRKKKTQFFCVDKVIDCSLTFSEAGAVLPETFCLIHRCYIVNTRYVSDICRYKLSMVTGETLPIPVHSYKRIKSILERHAVGRADGD